MTTAIKTNLSSSSNGCSLAALKKHITTCIHRWRKKYTTKSQKKHLNEHCQDQSIYQEENCYCRFQQNFSKRRFTKDHSFVQRTSVYCKSINTKVQKLITSIQYNKNKPTTSYDSEGPRQYGRKVEIVAKLLSSTLIAKKSSETKNDSSLKKQIKFVHNSTATSTVDSLENEMTVTDLSFLELREEYPDLDSEIRSILTARAQEGATISQIRDDYRKLTGLTFPIYDDVTEFLLTIPHVTAYCSEKGTRIFNIRPMNKTKHIHDMVIHQKPHQIEPPQRPSSNNYYYRERLRNNNYQPLNWRRNTRYRISENNANFDMELVNNGDDEKPPSSDNNLSKDGSECLFENNCFYQDNCNYLFNRICNQQQEPLSSNVIEKVPQIPVKSPVMAPLINAESNTALNSLNDHIASYKSNINHLNSLFQIHHQQHNNLVHLNNLKNIDARRSSLNPYNAPSRSSSPTVKSWYTSESAYTDSDYEAHLLDFLLLGDDFFLYMARMELRCKFKKNERVLQSGLCVSGQTIGAAIKRIKALGNRRRSIILNIGSVDIMQGRKLIQIEHDFRELLLIMLKKGIKPIITTLAPLANYSHNKEVKRTIMRFNDFIKREGQKRNLAVIDIWKCLVNERGHVFFDCYQNEPRNVSGTSESYLFWNKIGRQRVLQLIESKLEY